MDEERNEANADDADDAEHDHDTGLLSSPVAAAGHLRKVVASDERVLDGGHFDYVRD